MEEANSNGPSSQYLAGVQRSGRGWAEAGRGQVIVTHAVLTLEGAGPGDPLLTQLYQLGVEWTQAIVNMSGQQSHLCALLLDAKTGSEEGGAGEKFGVLLPVPGAQCTSLGSPEGSLLGFTFGNMVACFRQEVCPALE